MLCMGVNDGVYDARRTPSSRTRRAPRTASHRWRKVLHDAIRHRAGLHQHRARLHERPAAPGPGDRDPFGQARPAPHARGGAVDHPEHDGRRQRDRARSCPTLKGKLDGMSLRVPTPTGSITDFVAMLREDVERRRDQRRVPHRLRRQRATAACSSTATSRSCRPTSCRTRRRASSRRSTRWRTAGW